jgi:hypothetical protein
MTRVATTVRIGSAAALLWAVAVASAGAQQPAQPKQLVNAQTDTRSAAQGLERRQVGRKPPVCRQRRLLDDLCLEHQGLAVLL